jgi:flagellar motor switch protein FliM
MLVAAEAKLVSWIVECRFGGSGRLPIAISDGEFTPIELHAMHRIVEQVLQQFAVAWRPILTVEPEIVRHEIRPIFAAVANPTDLVIVSNFDFRIAGGGGRFSLAIPFALLEPYHDKLVAGVAAKPSSHDMQWAQALQSSVARAATVLQVELAAVEMTVRDFLALEPGNIIEIDRPDSVTVQAYGLPLFRGRWGSHGQKIAIRVEEQIDPADDATAAAHDEGETIDDER